MNPRHIAGDSPIDNSIAGRSIKNQKSVDMEFKKIIEIEDRNDNGIFLLRRGGFYRAYNQSAMRFEKLFFPYKISSKFIKKEKRQVYSLGFPASVLVKIKDMCTEKRFDTEEGDDFFKISHVDIENEDFEQWCHQHQHSQQQSSLFDFKQININTEEQAEILKMVANYPLERKTPFEAFQFLYDIQSRLKLT